MAEPNYRALCAELLCSLEQYPVQPPRDRDLIDRARAALAQPEPQGPTDEEIDALVICIQGLPVPDADDLALPSIDRGRDMVRKALARWGRPAIEPVPVAERLPGCASERFEFSVLDSEHQEQAGGTAPTYSQALSEGLHYLAVYSQDGPHSLELRRVEVLPHHALPVPQQDVK